MQKRSLFKASRCQDICCFCAARLGTQSPTLRTRTWATTRQFRSSTRSYKPQGAAVAIEEDNSSAPAQPSQPKPAFGGGWAKSTFGAAPRLTPEEEKQRQALVSKQAAQQAEEKRKSNLASTPKNAPNPPRFTIRRNSPVFRPQFGRDESRAGTTTIPDRRSDQNPQRYKPDWKCPRCSFSCHAHRTTCPKCNSPPGSDPSPGLIRKVSPPNMPEGVSPDYRNHAPRERSSVDQREQEFKRTPVESAVQFRKVDLHQNFQSDENSRIRPRDPAPDASRSSKAAASRKQESDDGASRYSRQAQAADDGGAEDPDEIAKQLKRQARLAETSDAEDDVRPGKSNKPSSKRQGRNASKRSDPESFYDDGEFDDYPSRSSKRQQKKKRDISEPAGPTPIYLPEFISVRNLAEVLSEQPANFLRLLDDMGFEGTKQTDILDSETAGLIAAEFNFEPLFINDKHDLTAAPPAEDKSILPSRPPVVTIMGHVDHGKTTILDFLRKSSVAASEHGGITQHIGAFSVPMPSGKLITFLDTPGHAAFLDMRRRGADVTDIVILVVAADDSVKPQTIEAIKHAKEAKVPIIVAINKTDKENADPERVKQDLARNNVDVEDYGGDVQAVCVSGKTGKGMLELEEAAVTLSELLDHRAEADGKVEGWVIEATAKKGGRVATVLVKRGTMRPGDIIVAGTSWARIRTLRNEAGVQIEEATPGTPVQVDGWREQPAAGSEVLQAPTEQIAKGAVEVRLEKVETKKLSQDMEAINESRRTETERRQKEADAEAALKAGTPAAEDSTEDIPQSGPKGVPFFVKADVSGSTEALVNSIAALGNNEVFPHVLRSGVGPVSEFDVQHAAIAKGHIISFNQSIEPTVLRMAEMEGVRIMDHNIIYEVIDDVKSKLSDYLPPTVTQRVTGEAEISEIFNISTKGRETVAIAGCKVRNGLINRNQKTRVMRGTETVYDGTLTSLKNVKKDVVEMRKGTECGLGFDGWTDFLPGDHVQCYEEIFEKRYL